MGELDFDNILGEQEIDTLFTTPEDTAPEEQEIAKEEDNSSEDDNKDNNKKNTAEEVDPETIFESLLGLAIDINARLNDLLDKLLNTEANDRLDASFKGGNLSVIVTILLSKGLNLLLELVTLHHERVASLCHTLN